MAVHSSVKLYDHISALIRADGPLTVASYMSEVLNHPTLGYYANNNPIGESGDFVTAPEISQLYGELVGAWLIDCWERLGEPDPVVLVELGPGRGTFISDFWRVAIMVPKFAKAISIYLVETSPVLREQQKHQFQALGAPDRVMWVKRFTEIPDVPFLLVANEFFDALPVHQFVRSRGRWRERLVDVDPNENSKFCYVIGPHTPATSLIATDIDVVGETLEICPAGILLAETIGEKLCRVLGAALVVDFGLASPSLSFQAVMSHSMCDPLTKVGEADLSCAVDFGALGSAAIRAGARVHGPVSQGALLRSLGIEERAAALMKDADYNTSRLVVQGKERLIEPFFMGQLFQALAITSQALSCVEGFNVA
jgi:NADH dehydrogenase [ubiquinone] 1 alpha subcomplex assembly factor 7